MRTGKGDSEGWRTLLSQGNLARLVIVCFGVWLHAADSLLVATMMPDIVTDIGGARFVAWTVALYEIGSIGSGASAAVLAMRYGLRPAMTVAALVYLAGCAVSAMAPAMWVMLAGRLAQGLGGGGLAALSFIAISLLFSRSVMPRVMAAVSALWGIAAFIGPLVGGVFADLDLWRDGFWFFAAQALLLAVWIGVSRALRQPDGGVAAAARLPVWRLGVLSLGVLAIAAAGISIRPVATPLMVAAGLVLLALFLRMDGRREANRLLPRNPIDPRNGVGAALLMVLCFSSATIAFSVYGPLLLTALHEIPALVAGYMIAASSIGWSVMAIVVSGAKERHDGALILGGMGIITVSIAGLAFAVPHGSLFSVLVFALLEGGGFGLAWTFILRRVTALAPSGETARAAAAMPTLQQIGYALGASYVGIVANSAGFADRIARETAEVVGFWIFAACLPLALVGLYAAWRFVSFAGRPALADGA